MGQKLTDILLEREVAVDLQARLQVVVLVLLDHALRLLIVVLLRLVLPPVPGVANLIKLGADVVEAVGDLVADHVADGAKVEVLRPVVVEEDVAEDARGDDDRVRLRPVEGVHIGGVGKVLPAGKKERRELLELCEHFETCVHNSRTHL